MTRLAILIATLATLCGGVASAGEYKAGALTIKDPWVRATPKGATVGGGYVTVVNDGVEADRLVGASLADGGRAEVHEMSMAGGIMKMRPVADGVEIKPGETVALKPGGYHMMFLNLRKPLTQGEMVDGTLVFQKAGTVQVKFQIESVGAMGGHQAAH
jgi:copper(I)-binding protein